MEMQSSGRDSKGFLQNDKLLVCSMLAIYGICIVGAIGAAFFGLNRMSRRLSTAATSTAVAVSTQQAQASATAMVRSTEQAQYDFIDPFDSNKHKWRVGSEKNEYWDGYTKITDGMYAWNVRTTKNTFISWADYPLDNYLKDFDVYVDTKINDTEPGNTCSGLLFRVDPAGWDAGGYFFVLCNDSSVKINYHTDADGWEHIADRFYFDNSGGWNRLEIIARGSHFNFLINGRSVHEMNDGRKKAGGLALVIDVTETAPATVWFDNFGLQRR